MNTKNLTDILRVEGINAKGFGMGISKVRYFKHLKQLKDLGYMRAEQMTDKEDFWNVPKG